LSGRAVVYSET